MDGLRPVLRLCRRHPRDRRRPPAAPRRLTRAPPDIAPRADPAFDATSSDPAASRLSHVRESEGGTLFARVIVGVDGADGGLDAVTLAGAMADPEADVILAHVAPPSAGSADDPFAGSREILRIASGAAAAHETSQRRVEGRSVAAGLHHLAGELAADLVVVGSHHRRRTGRLWSGDRTRATLRDAPCPVAVAPQDLARTPVRPLRVLGVAYDDGPEARDALLFGRALASECGARIQVLWVVDRSNWTDSESGVGWKAVAAGRRLAEVHGVGGVVVEAGPGRVRAALEDMAHDVDLLILGSHHHALLRRIVLGDVIEGLSRHTACPLLVLPHARGRARR